MKRMIPLLGALLLAAATGLHAQTPPGEPGKGRHPRVDCSKAKDPQACEARRAKAREAFGKAHQACDGKQGDERRACMRDQMCAQAKDPAQCQANSKARAERRHQAREACKDQQGEARRACLRQHYRK